MKKIITVHDLIHEKFRDFYRNSQYLINLKKKSKLEFVIKKRTKFFHDAKNKGYQLQELY